MQWESYTAEEEEDYDDDDELLLHTQADVEVYDLGSFEALLCTQLKPILLLLHQTNVMIATFMSE